MILIIRSMKNVSVTTPWVTVTSLVVTMGVLFLTALFPAIAHAESVVPTYVLKRFPTFDEISTDGDETIFFDTVTIEGDYNGDGFADLFICSGLIDTVSAALIFGSSIVEQKLSVEDDADVSFYLTDTDLKCTPQSLGDINNDGFDDLAVQAVGTGSILSTTYMVYGKATWATAIDLVENADAIIVGDKDNVRIIDAIGDVNGDAIDDVIVTTIEETND